MGQIFTEDLPEVEALPRDRVLNFLKEGFKELAVPYLEHIIHVWEDTVPEFHNVLIELYLERVQALMKEYLVSLPEGRNPMRFNNDLNPFFLNVCQFVLPLNWADFCYCLVFISFYPLFLSFYFSPVSCLW